MWDERQCYSLFPGVDDRVDNPEVPVVHIESLSPRDILVAKNRRHTGSCEGSNN